MVILLNNVLCHKFGKYLILGNFNFSNHKKAHQSNRVCNALGLLQCVASHNETRALFLQAHIPIFLYPFLHTTSSKTRPFEYLRLTSLGVIGALVKVLNLMKPF